MCLRADVNGCKQKKERRGERKEKKKGLTTGGGHERAVRIRTLFERMERVYNMSEHCLNTWKGSIACPNTVQTVVEQHVKQCVMSEHCSKCSNSSPLHGDCRSLVNIHVQ